MKGLSFIILYLLFVSSTLCSVEWNIYIDADFSNATESSESIQLGIEVALERYLPDGYHIDIIPLDHRGNSRRSLKNLETFKSDPKGIAVFCGLHSPPVLSNLNYINENKLVLLDPWAAATAITRTPDEDGRNWIYRLSIDDSQAGEVITAHSLDKEGFKRPLLLLEDTGWGRANEKTFKKALNDKNMETPQILWFNWQLGKLGAKKIISDIMSYNPDVIFLVANAIEGEMLLREIANMDKVIPVRSHWGITGGHLYKQLKDEINSNKLNLKFIQTSFLFTNKNLTSYQQRTWDFLSSYRPEIQKWVDLKAPLGFIHAYDLTKILIEVLPRIDTSQTIEEQRIQLREVMESDLPVINGLIKMYQNPFNQASHEALNKDDFQMGRYSETGAIVLVD